jgi:hypothetical protein
VFHNETFMQHVPRQLRRKWTQVLEKSGQGAFLTLGTPLA